MDCREFRNKHVAYVDDLLPACEMDAMQRHLMVCSRCSRQDTAVRRSLLLVRNLPPIQPSPDFIHRLNARLEALGPVSRVDVVGKGFSRAYLPSVGAFAALAAGVAAIAYMAVETTRYFVPPEQFGSPPAVASAQVNSVNGVNGVNGVTAPADPIPAPMANPAFVASVPTGMPVWPAVLMVGEAPTRFASLEFKDANLTR